MSIGLQNARHGGLQSLALFQFKGQSTPNNHENKEGTQLSWYRGVQSAYRLSKTERIIPTPRGCAWGTYGAFNHTNCTLDDFRSSDIAPVFRMHW